MSEHLRLLKTPSGKILPEEEYVREQLEIILQKLDAEIGGKQKTIEHQELEIQRLHTLLEEKNSLLLQNTEKLANCLRNSDGNRQLTNKLLNDIERFQRDIEWYKRTYETRSLMGVIMDKLKHLISGRK